MYRIIGYDSPYSTAGYLIYDNFGKQTITEGKLTITENEVDRLDLTVNQNNYLFGRGEIFSTHVEVYQGEEIIFRGRCIEITRAMKDNGQFVQKFIFEDIQNYLLDSLQRYKKVQNTTPAQFFNDLIAYHNRQVPDYKKFTVRNVTVTNSTDNVYRYIDYVSTWDTIKDKLLTRLGGYIKVQRKDGINYIDYLAEPGTTHQNTAIAISVNMKAASVDIDPTEMITRLIPLGAVQESKSDPDAAAQPRINIATVNGGDDYLDMPELTEKFGAIYGAQIWDDIHDPAILLTRAKQWMAKQKIAKESWEVSALELPNIEKFKVSDSYVFNNRYVSEKQTLRIIEKDIDFLKPNNSSLKIADKKIPLSYYQKENRNAARQVQQLKTRVNNQGTEINTLNNQTVEMSKTIKSQQGVIDQMRKDIDNGDFAAIENKLTTLTNSVNSLGNQIENLDYVTNEQFNAQVDVQSSKNTDFENRISALEGGSNSGS